MKIELNYTAEQMVDAIVEGIQEKKGTNIAILDLRNIEHSVCQFFVVCDGDSNVQVNAIADSVDDYLRKHLKERPYRIEGKANSEWVLVDYIDVVVHVFKKDVREFFNLEGLWADAQRRDIENMF